MNVRVGTSGRQYRHWRGLFYPRDVRTADWLLYYSQAFDTVEVNATFYRTPSPETVAERFLFTVKAYKGITHFRRLRATPLDLEKTRMIVRGLGSKLGMLLFQLPPSYKKDTESVVRIARQFARYRPAFEFRHASWFEDPDVEARVTGAGGTVVTVDSPAFRTPVYSRGPFAYPRFHGRETMFSHDYTNAELRGRAKEARARLGRTRTLFACFNNDVGGHAVGNARSFRRLLAQKRL